MKILKISTWTVLITALLMVLMVAFFVAFPWFFKAPIEQQLSKLSGLTVSLSGISFNIENNDLFLQIDDFDISTSSTDSPLAEFDNFKWHISLIDLLDKIYYPRRIDIEILTLNTQVNTNYVISMAKIKKMALFEKLESLRFFESLSINKTYIKGKEFLEIAPLVLQKEQSKLTALVSNQSIGNQLVDISATLSSDGLKEDFFSLPIKIKNDEFELLSVMKLYAKKKQNFVELSVDIKKINAANIKHYFPPSIMDKKTYQWMQNAFKSGKFETTEVLMRKNLTTLAPMQLTFKSHLSNANVLFDKSWQSLKQLDADIISDGNKVDIMINKAMLNGSLLKDFKVNVANSKKNGWMVTVIGNVVSKSEKLLEFLKAAPLGDSVDKILAQFSLSGDLSGLVNVSVPIDDKPIVVKVDASIKNNRLTTLNGFIVVDNYDAKVTFDDNKITSIGSGDIRERTFDIYINPDRDDYQSSPFSVALVNKSGFKFYLDKCSTQFWCARIDSDIFKTKAEITVGIHDLPVVKVLNFELSELNKTKDDWHIKPSDFPSMYLIMDNILVNNKKIPDFSVKLYSEQDVLQINNLTFKGVGVSNKDLLFDGAWIAGKTRLIAKVKGDKLSEFLQKLKIKEPVIGGEFEFDIRLFCDCTPWNISLKDVSGILDIKVKKGIFTEKDMGMGKLLSLLNIKSLVKRLNNDDISNKGFAYNNININIVINNAVVKINRFNLHADSSNIKLAGDSNIITQQYNLEARVLPLINDVVPVTTYLAGGGLAGLGAWLFDKILFKGDLINNIVDTVIEFRYKITGSWDKPVIKNISTVL